MDANYERIKLLLNDEQKLLDFSNFEFQLIWFKSSFGCWLSIVRKMSVISKILPWIDPQTTSSKLTANEILLIGDILK